MRGRAVSAAWSITTRRSTRPLASRNFPLVILPMSSRSSTSRTIFPTWRPMMSPARPMIGSFVRTCRMMLRALRMGERGLRSSWESRAMNSCLLRLASASPSARFRCASAASLSVRSCITLANDRACLCSSNSGVTTDWHQNRVPSFRTCQRTLSERPSSDAALSSCSGRPVSTSSGEKKREKCWPMISWDW